MLLHVLHASIKNLLRFFHSEAMLYLSAALPPGARLVRPVCTALVCVCVSFCLSVCVIIFVNKISPKVMNRF